MKMNYTPKDWQILSNYLDGHCSPREVDLVNLRLKNEPQFQQAFKEMQQTRYLLQHARKVPVPRSFTITPEMAAQIKPVKRPLIPIFSYASMVAAIFLVVLLFFDFLPGILPGSKLSKSAAPMLAMESAPAAELSMDAAAAPMLAAEVPQDAENPPMIIEWAPASGYGMGGGGEAQPMLSSMPPEEDRGSTPSEPEIPAAPAAPPAAEESGPMLKSMPEPITGSGPILGARSAEEAEAYNESVLNELRESSVEVSPEIIQPFPWLRLSQILLAVIAISSATIAVILRRKSI